MLLRGSLAALAILSGVLTLWQWLAAFGFPLHRRAAGRSFFPSITLLKPLKGRDAHTAKCLASWMNQNYPGPMQILFGVASTDDPVCSVVKELILAHPKLDAHLVICPEPLGANPKISTLAQIESNARHEVIVLSDADVFVEPGFLVELVRPMQKTEVGLVNCFYELRGADNLAMRWEAFAVNADFWSQVLQARTLKPLDFALGAVMAVPRNVWQNIGGAKALLDYLADDYELGQRIARSGKEIVLSPIRVACLLSPMSWREVWAHQSRWARTIRFCQPTAYFFSVLSNATFWPLLWFICESTAPTAIAVCSLLLFRMVSGAYCEHKLTGKWQLSSLVIAPIKDLLQMAIWAGAFLGNKVVWRGSRFRVLRGGKLVNMNQG
ncbi:MAG TPA: bacteriohopanetetrol glucosamine biosynthesis glycosyltransferase HpnI [Verrucomicrobiae bacterium]